jgi:hypothetical protein
VSSAAEEDLGRESQELIPGGGLYLGADVGLMRGREREIELGLSK